VGQFLLDKGCDAQNPLLILAENSLATASLLLGALYVGVPVAPISPAYVSQKGAHDKLKVCVDTLKPRVAYVGQLGWVQQLVQSCDLPLHVVTPDALAHHTALQVVLETMPTQAADQANGKVGPDTIAKYLFTSGSTGTPKGVINTHRMLCANQQQLRQIFPFLLERQPILVDWLPWHHTFGGNEVFFLAMCNGGTLHIDQGKPVGTMFEQTITNLREISPTIHFNVPLAFHQLVVRMREDPVLSESFFRRLDLMFYAGAGMPQQTWSDLEALAERVRGHRVPMVTAWGATETAPLATGVFFESHRADNVGIPVPGCEIKFAPVDERFELRVRGPNVMPGYLGRPDLTARVFDEEGYFCSGDAASLADENDPSKGIIFEGRISEDFKLQSGTWVSVGRLRGLLMGELLPLVSDVVIAGQGRDRLGLLVFLDAGVARRHVGQKDLNYAALAHHPAIHEYVCAAIARHNAMHPGSSARIDCYAIPAEPASTVAREITDKGSLNQANVLSHRAKVVQEMFGDDAD
jgi:feruloyl-CoA synthase